MVLWSPVVENDSCKLVLETKFLFFFISSSAVVRKLRTRAVTRGVIRIFMETFCEFFFFFPSLKLETFILKLYQLTTARHDCYNYIDQVFYKSKSIRGNCCSRQIEITEINLNNRRTEGISFHCVSYILHNRG